MHISLYNKDPDSVILIDFKEFILSVNILCENRAELIDQHLHFGFIVTLQLSSTNATVTPKSYGQRVPNV